MTQVVVTSDENLRQEVRAGRHILTADEPLSEEQGLAEIAEHCPVSRYEGGRMKSAV